MYNEPLKRKSYEKLEQVMHIYEKRIFIKIGELSDVSVYRTNEHLRTVPAGDWQPIEKGDSWGGEWQNLWVKGVYTATNEYSGKKLYAVSNAGGVEQLFFVNGIPAGLFNSKNFEFIGGAHSAEFFGEAAQGVTWSLAFECYAGHFCVGDSPSDNYEYPNIPENDYRHTYNGVDICIMDESVKDFVFDLQQLLQAAMSVPDGNFLKARAMRALDKVLKTIVFDPKNTSEQVWKDSVERSLEITRSMFAGGNSRIFGKLGLIGHSHMDTAWLWPVSETIRKCARTYSNALSLMQQYPEYRFVQSSALHCEWMKDYYPGVFAQMQKRVAEGRYEPNGGVYVECDCNITSGELMIRQFLKGQQFTRKYFNYSSDSFWLPDTFGYNGNIPQIMRGCEIKYFYTTKISWNELNRFPYESFVWKGIDGSSVLTHYNVSHCYPDVETCLNAINGIQLKETSDMRLVAFGFGDGGGGPTSGMLESIKRVSSLEGMPEIEIRTVSSFMKELEKDTEYLPVYEGELYLELHRGTLTQMHDVKRKNRKAEFALRNMEYFNVISRSPMNNNADKWCKILLKNQFHDILPGTCITPVYEKYNEEMDELIASYKSAAAGYTSKITESTEKRMTLYNTLSFARNDVHTVKNAGGWAAQAPSQRYTDICGRDILAVGNTEIPAFGATVIEIADEPIKAASVFKYDGAVLETPFAVIQFGKDGFISSFVDKKSGRELRKLDGEPLNVLLTAQDFPRCWDNWDVEYDTINSLTPISGFESRELITDGAVELRLRSTFRFGEGSSIVQDMVVYANDARVDFHTLVHWQEKHCMLKAGFDVDIAAQSVRNEIQYGHVIRPTTRNNSLEYAKFEVCNYKWTDISESRFGASILNDCKYGITVSDGNLRLSLHRGGTHPDVTGDAGDHEMTYSFLVHDGSFSAKNVVRPSYELNVPAVAVRGEAHISEPFLTIDADNIICETVKPAENTPESYAIRLYECEGTPANAVISLSRKGKKIFETNMLEDITREIVCEDGKLKLKFKPFEIKTFVVCE